MTSHQVFPRSPLSSIPFAPEWMVLFSQCLPLLRWVSHEHWYCSKDLAFLRLSAFLSLSWLVFRLLGYSRLPVVGKRVLVLLFMSLWTGLLPMSCDGILRSATNPKWKSSPPLVFLRRRSLADLIATSTFMDRIWFHARAVVVDNSNRKQWKFYKEMWDI